MKKLTPQQKFIVGYLRCRPWWTPPTEIGRAYGQSVNHPHKLDSRWASPKCKRLVELGFLERDRLGWYRLKRERRG